MRDQKGWRLFFFLYIINVNVNVTSYICSNIDSSLSLKRVSVLCPDVEAISTLIWRPHIDFSILRKRSSIIMILRSSGFNRLIRLIPSGPHTNKSKFALLVGFPLTDLLLFVWHHKLLWHHKLWHWATETNHDRSHPILLTFMTAYTCYKKIATVKRKHFFCVNKSNSWWCKVDQKPFI